MIRALHHSLLARVLASSLTLAAVMVFGLTSLFLWDYSRELERQLLSRADALAGFLAGQSQFAMLVGDRTELERIARNAVSSDQVISVELTDAEGGAPVRFRRAGSRPSAGNFTEIRRQVLRPSQVDGAWETDAARRPSGPAVLGTVRLEFSTQEQHAALLRIVRATVAIALAFLLAAAGVQTLQMRTLLRPLQALTGFTRRVAAGDLNGRAEVVRPDEVGRLTMAFNTMVERLGATLVSKEKAEAADAAKSRFLATMSHELRTPLNAVIGYSQLIREVCGDRGIQGLDDDLSRIERAGGLLLSLVNQVLDYSKAEAGKIELHPETFQVRPVIQDVIATVQPLAAKNRNRVSVVAAAGRGRDARRPAALPAEPAEPGVECLQVHRGRRSHRGTGARARRAVRLDPGQCPRHRYRDRSRTAGQAVPGLHAGRRFHHPQVRRHRPGAGHQQADVPADGRRYFGRKRAGQEARTS